MPLTVLGVSDYKPLTNEGGIVASDKLLRPYGHHREPL